MINYNKCEYAGCNDTLVHTMLKAGPLVTSIDATSIVSYKSGYFYPTTSTPCTKTNHVVVIVGYGTDTVGTTKTSYWLVRNSWGTGWGMAGYFKVKDVQGIDQDSCFITRAVFQPYF